MNLLTTNVKTSIFLLNDIFLTVKRSIQGHPQCRGVTRVFT